MFAHENRIFLLLIWMLPLLLSTHDVDMCVMLSAQNFNHTDFRNIYAAIIYNENMRYDHWMNDDISLLEAWFYLLSFLLWLRSECFKCCYNNTNSDFVSKTHLNRFKCDKIVLIMLLLKHHHRCKPQFKVLAIKKRNWKHGW